jgi:hypothetical protein
MRSRILLSILLISCLRGRAYGGQTLEHALSGSSIDHIAEAVGWDVIVATVVEVSTHKATNGKPPLVKLKVYEVLRGDKKTNRESAIWRPIPHDFDNGPPEKDPRFKKWQVTPMESPKLGVKMILCGQVSQGESDSRFYIAPVGREGYSDKTRELARKGIRKREESRKPAN